MASNNSFSQRWRMALIISIVAFAGIAAMFIGPVAQPLSYHQLADQRRFLNIPNALDVISNFPFIVVGFLGLDFCVRDLPKEVLDSWLVFFIGISLVAAGSAYYHWAPNNQTLAWDRLPMTIAFMGLFIALLSEYINAKIERFCLIPAVVLGIGSVVYWHYTDDLRPYGLIQYVPLLTLPILLFLFKARFTHQRYLIYALGWYLLAKVCENFDKEIFRMTGQFLSGHTLKHLFAACGALSILLMLRRRSKIT